MQKRVVAILVFCLIKNVLSYCAAISVDPFTLALEQFLSDITVETIPYPNYPYACPVGQCLPYIINPYIEGIQCGGYPGINPCVVESTYQCAYPEYLDCSCLYNPMDFEMPYLSCSSCADMSCGIVPYPKCSCYRDIKDPCVVYEPAPPCICVAGYDTAGPAPYVYFPEVEYPMTPMDIRPYYYGNCWCS